MKTLIKITRFLLVLLIIAALFLFAAFLVNQKKKQLARAPKYVVQPIPVRVTTAKLGNLSTKIDYLAVVEPVQIANVSARLTATVDKLLCDEGDTVKAGQVLIVLDSREIENSIAATEANIAQAQSELAANQATVTSLQNSVAYWNREAERDKTLADKGDIAGSQAEATADKASEIKGSFDAAKHKSTALEHLIDSARNKKAELETKLSYCTIKSPYNGLVTQRLVDPGDMASPGTKLLVVEDRSQLKLAFDIPQQDLPNVHEALDVQFTVNGLARQARLSHMFPSLNAARMLRAEVFLSGDRVAGLSVGQYIEASVILDQTKASVLLPAASLAECPKHSPRVFVVKGDSLTLHKVKILASTEDTVAVEGVEPGEQVVTNTFLGWTILSAGKKVEVLK
jgi:RND family efflux transporter MFP subunit